MVPDRQKVRTDGLTDDAKTISLRLRRGIIKFQPFIMICDNLDHQTMLVYFPKLLSFLCTRFSRYLGNRNKRLTTLFDLKREAS